MTKGFCIAYEVENSLYLNVTNRCSNSCDFCIRNNGDGAYGSDSLWLSREPLVDEIVNAIEERDLSKYKELVFCGYGEPCERLYDLLEVCHRVKAKHDIPIRVNTNGQANLIFGRDTTPDFCGAIDAVSISLNAADSEKYDAICHSRYGVAAFDAILDFAKKVKNYVQNVAFSVVDASLSAEEIEKCREISSRIGIPLRVREYIGA